MKKLFLVIVMMAVWASGMFAQTTNENETSVDTDDIEVGVDTTSMNSEVKAKRSFPKKQYNQQIDYEELAKAVYTFNKVAQDAQNEGAYSLEPIKHCRNDWFSRKFHASQRLEISIIGGTDGDDADNENAKTDYDQEDNLEKKSNFNWGLNFGYTYSLLFGKTDEKNMFHPGKFGFSINTGFNFSFDRQNVYGTTFDFLLKLGAEAGNGHPLGVEFDLLFGTGKSAGDLEFEIEDEDSNDTPSSNESSPNDDPDIVTIPYTAWCMKYGFQISLRSNLLQAKVKNTDVRLFARYVYSKNPDDEDELEKQGIYCFWHAESWSFGLTLCYTF